MNKEIIYKILNIIAIGLILLSGTMAVQVYYNEKKTECISEPLSYAARMYEDKTGYPFAGSGTFISEGDLKFTRIWFDSEGIRLEDPKIQERIIDNKFKNITASLEGLLINKLEEQKEQKEHPV